MDYNNSQTQADPVYPPPAAPTYAEPVTVSGGGNYGTNPAPPGYNASGYGAPPPGQGAPPPGYGVQPAVYGNQPPPVAQAKAPRTIIINQPMTVRGGMHFGHMPTTMTCPKCNVTTVTRVTSSLSTQGIICIILLLVFLFWPWCLLPLCMPGCKNHEHYCSNCGHYVGGFHP